MLKIDTHAHWFPPEWVELLAKEGGNNGAKIGRNDRGQVTFAVPGIRSKFQATYIELGLRLKMMDDARVDIHALSLTSPMVYWAPPEFGLKLSQVFNDACAAAHLKYPNRFVGMATLPMQNPNLAVQEADRAAKLPGIRGIYPATHVNGKNFEDKSFWPVYERCEALGLPIFLHPVNPVGAERMQGYHLRNFLGNPYETGIAAASLMFGGVMDAFPKLDVMLPHAGGGGRLLVAMGNRAGEGLLGSLGALACYYAYRATDAPLMLAGFLAVMTCDAHEMLEHLHARGPA